MHAITAEPTIIRRAGAQQAGRPLRFLATVLLLWSGGRMMAAIGPIIDGGASPPARFTALSGKMAAGISFPAPQESLYRGPIVPMTAAASRRLDRIPIIRAQQPDLRGAQVRMAVLTVPLPPAASAAGRPTGAMLTAAAVASVSVPPVPPSVPEGTERRRWSGSAWLLWRNRGAGG